MQTRVGLREPTKEELALCHLLKWWTLQEKEVTWEELFGMIRNKEETGLLEEPVNGQRAFSASSLIYAICQKPLRQQDPLAKLWKTMQMRFFKIMSQDMLTVVEKLEASGELLMMQGISHQVETMQKRIKRLRKMKCQALDEEAQTLLDCYLSLSSHK